MSPLLDSITAKKLILVKQLYQQAILQSASQYSTIKRILGVIGFDLAIETLLKTVVMAFDSSKVPPDKFNDIVQRANALLIKNGLNELPDRGNINYVHSIRNDAQHKAKYPNMDDVSDCRTYTRDFVDKIVNEVWAVSFEDISLSDSIQHIEIKKIILEAETALSQEDYQKAVENAAVGLTRSLIHVQKAIVGYLEYVNLTV